MPWPKPGRAELLAREQAVENLAPRDAVVVLEQQADLLEHALLAGDVEVDQDVGFGQQLGDEVHVFWGDRRVTAALGDGYSSACRPGALSDGARASFPCA